MNANSVLLSLCRRITGGGKSSTQLIIMTNITSTLLETLTLNYSIEWPVNGNNSHESDTFSLFIAPLAVALKHGKHNLHPESVSPVTLSTEWSRLARLIFLTIMSVIGSVGSIFMISSIMIEDQLKKAGKGELEFVAFNLEHSLRRLLNFVLSIHSCLNLLPTIESSSCCNKFSFLNNLSNFHHFAFLSL